jgi:hypothetical protein
MMLVTPTGKPPPLVVRLAEALPFRRAPECSENLLSTNDHVPLKGGSHARLAKPLSRPLGLQVSHCFYAKVQTPGDLWTTPQTYRADHPSRLQPAVLPCAARGGPLLVTRSPSGPADPGRPAACRRPTGLASGSPPALVRREAPGGACTSGSRMARSGRTRAVEQAVGISYTHRSNAPAHPVDVPGQIPPLRHPHCQARRRATCPH